jgi:uncharacterized protein with NRDE domain
LVVVSRVWPELPLLVAANRDELLGRPNWPPAEYPAKETRVFGPRDAVAGGTWLGVNEHGLFAGITNRFGVAPDPSRRSRGLLVTDALSKREIEDAVAKSSAHSPSEHNGFHLVLATRDSAALVYHDGASVTQKALGPGVHVYTERSLGAANAAREHRVRRAFDALAAKSSAPSDEEIIQILSVPSTKDAPFDGTVMDVSELNYGTRSSTIIRMLPSAIEFKHADGPPTRTPYRSYEVFSNS